MKDIKEDLQSTKVERVKSETLQSSIENTDLTQCPVINVTNKLLDCGNKLLLQEWSK